jgi:hypothetical protein
MCNFSEASKTLQDLELYADILSFKLANVLGYLAVTRNISTATIINSLGPNPGLEY